MERVQALFGCGTLTPYQSEQTERLARLFAFAERVFGDRDHARAFMQHPHPDLQGRRPVDAALTELAAAPWNWCSMR